MTELVAEIARLTGLGLRVFPARPGGKSPAMSGWQAAATADPDRAAELIARFPGCNLAVATGQESGVFVLDVDTKGVDGWLTLYELQAALGELSPTWRTKTPSTGGHFWFHYPDERRIGNSTRIRPGLDLRGEGGLIVVPPSTTDTGGYSWLTPPASDTLASAPGWLLDLASAPVRQSAVWAANAVPAASRAALASRVAVELAHEAERVEQAAPGTRNNVLFQAGATLGELVGAGVLRRGFADAALELAAEACGLVRDDGLAAVRATIDSGLERGASNPRQFEP